MEKILLASIRLWSRQISPAPRSIRIPEPILSAELFLSMHKTDNLESYRVFCAVAACANVKEAAVRLSMEPSNIFRTLRQLEADLGVALFERVSRPMRLTERGEIFLVAAQKILEEQATLLEALRDNLDSESGMIQIASTAGVRRQILTPALVEYLELNPGISVELRDMMRGSRNFFVAPEGSMNDVVITYQTDQSLPEGTHVEELFDMPFIACSSPLYLQRNGTPTHPEACSAHRAILLRVPGRTSVTHLSCNGVYERLDWRSTTTYMSQLDAIEALVLGGGICPDVALPYIIEELRQGRLVSVMPGWHCPTRTVCLYASEHAYRKRRVRRFLEWFAQRYRAYFADCLAAYKTLIPPEAQGAL